MDKIARDRRSRNMAAIRGVDTKPELFVRRILYSMGYRYGSLHNAAATSNPNTR